MGCVHIDGKFASDGENRKYCSYRDAIIEVTLDRYAKTLRSAGFGREYILGHTARDAREWYPNDPARCAALVAQVAQHFQ